MTRWIFIMLQNTEQRFCRLLSPDCWYCPECDWHCGGSRSVGKPRHLFHCSHRNPLLQQNCGIKIFRKKEVILFVCNVEFLLHLIYILNRANLTNKSTKWTKQKQTYIFMAPFYPSFLFEIYIFFTHFLLLCNHIGSDHAKSYQKGEPNFIVFNKISLYPLSMRSVNYNLMFYPKIILQELLTAENMFAFKLASEKVPQCDTFNPYFWPSLVFWDSDQASIIGSIKLIE